MAFSLYLFPVFSSVDLFTFWAIFTVFNLAHCWALVPVYTDWKIISVLCPYACVCVYVFVFLYFKNLLSLFFFFCSGQYHRKSQHRKSYVEQITLLVFRVYLDSRPTDKPALTASNQYNFSARKKTFTDRSFWDWRRLHGANKWINFAHKAHPRNIQLATIRTTCFTKIQQFKLYHTLHTPLINWMIKEWKHLDLNISFYCCCDFLCFIVSFVDAVVVRYL